MRPPLFILLYFVGTVLLGALLAPPLFWAGQALGHRASIAFLSDTEFQKYFNRAMLVAAVALLWPAVRALKISRLGDLGIVQGRRPWQRFFAGFSIAGLLVALMAGAYISFGIYRWKTDLPWGALPKLAVSAMAVSIIEELLFRGAIFGLFLKTLRPYAALFLTTFIFAILHFLKPDDDIVVDPVRWFSGFSLLPHVFHQFAEPMLLLGGFTTLFTLGWLLGYARLRTGGLWMSIGLHAGVVFVKMGFSKFTKRREEFLPWIGPELQIGLVPVAVLLAGVGLVWWWLNYVERNNPSRR